MRKVLMIPGPWHPIPPLKGAAVESIIYDLCKNIFLFETHIVSIKTPFHEHIETFAKHPFLRSVQGSVPIFRSEKWERIPCGCACHTDLDNYSKVSCEFA